MNCEGYNSVAAWQEDLELLKKRSHTALEKDDLPAATCSPAPPLTKRKRSLSPPPVARKVAKSRAEEIPHEAGHDASIEEQSSKMEVSEILNSGRRKASNLVTCEVCNNFTGRPSELRYETYFLVW